MNVLFSASILKGFSTATEHDVNMQMGATLKYAPDRRGGSGRKKDDFRKLPIL